MNLRVIVVMVASAVGIVSYGVPVDVSADGDDTLGILKVDRPVDKNAEAVVGVPFLKSPLYENMTVDQLLVAGYGVKDEIWLWNPLGWYDAWTWDDDEEAWTSVYIYGRPEPKKAEEQTVDRGKAFWFRTSDLTITNQLTLAGLVQSNATTTVAQGSGAEPKWTLLVNPFGTAVDIAAKLAEGAVTGDQISFVNGTVRYEYKSGQGWGMWVKGGIKKKIGNITIYYPDKFEVSETIVVPGGTAFWYISVGGNPTIAWDFN